MADKNQIVYIVTSGEYSDYGIDAVFLDEELANIYCDQHPNCRIQTYVANECVSKDDEFWYDVELCKNGEVEVRMSSCKYNRITYNPCGGGRLESFLFTVKTTGAKKAKAIAIERYNAFLAVEYTHFPMILVEFIPRFKNDFVTPNYDYFTYEIVLPCKLDIFRLFERARKFMPIQHREEDDEWDNLENEEQYRVLLEEMKAAGLNFRIEE